MLMFAILYFAPSRASIVSRSVCVCESHGFSLSCAWVCVVPVCLSALKSVSSWTSSYLPTSLSSSLTSKMQTKFCVCKVNKRGGSHVFMYNFLLHRPNDRPNNQLNDQFETVCKKRACSAAFAVLNFLWHQQPQKNNINWHFMFFFRIVSFAKCMSERVCLCVCVLERCWAFRSNAPNDLSRLHWQCVGCRPLSLIVSHKNENEMWRWQDNKNYACMRAWCSLLDHSGFK